MIGYFYEFDTVSGTVTADFSIIKPLKHSLRQSVVIANTFTGIGGVKHRGPSTQQPGQLVVPILLECDDDDDLNTYHTAFTDLLNETGTLRVEIRGPAITSYQHCTATLVDVVDRNLSTETRGWAVIDVVFDCFELWSAGLG